MATITTDLICNLNQPVAATFLHGNLFSQDNAGNTINVHVMDNGEPATIGGTVSANVIRADGNTVAVSGSLSGNQCSVVLPQACYAVPGRVEIIIKLTQSTTITTIAAIVANVYRSTTDTVVDPGTIIPSIQALIEEIEDAVDSIPVDYSGLLATIAADYSSSKTYQVGQYAWQGGVLKRNIVPITTAETYTAAHWTNAVLGDDVSALKSALSSEDAEINYLHNLVNYGYDTPANLAAVPSSTSGTEIGIKRDGQCVVLNGTSNSSTDVKIRLNGTVSRSTNSATVKGWNTNLFTPESGKKFKFTIRLLSGTSDGASISIYKTGTNSTVATDTHTVEPGWIEGTFTADGSGYNIILYLTKNRTYTNARYIIIMEDITDESVLNGYERLEYLESDGTQYISTSRKLTNKTRIVCRFAFTGLMGGSSYNYGFGSRTNSTTDVFNFGMTASGKSWYFGYGSSAKTAKLNDYTEPHEVDFNQNEVYIDGELIHTFDSETFETPSGYSLFATRGGSSGDNYYFGKVRIYSLKVYEDGVLMQDLVPVKRISDGVTGMINLGSGTLLTASATLTSGKPLTDENTFYDVLDVGSKIAESNASITALESKVFGNDYVLTEADRVAAKVRSVQTGNTLSFVAISDLHYAVAVGSSDGVTVAESQAAIVDMSNGIKRIAEQLHIDIYACFGDVIYQWQSHGANYNNGVKEAVNVTKLISEAFGNNPQVRLVGNHDPNCENATKEFNANMLNSFTGIYSEMLEKDEAHPYGAYGLHDFERQKIRLIVLNTSYYTPEDDIPNSGTRYYVGKDQADWLVGALDLSGKDDAAQWQIVIFSHVVLDATGQAKIYPYTDILAKYESGGSGSVTVDSKRTDYDFNGKNAASLALYINGHSHCYYWKNMRKIVSGNVDSVLKMANLYVPNALPGREEVSADGVTYTKTPDSAESTAFQIITIDPVSKIVYAHHYGAGIDVVMHYEPQTITEETTLTTDLTDPVWNSKDTDVATVSDGTITPVATGNTMIWAKSTDDNCIEVWNICVTV